mmetsp:Transcript_137865/g.384413  ORF Transcript_137865/g.384413 Transcript_137865/m.384413 type:complete len:377 (-) Transcript_137865:155-1285(-)|eukprot:CAMPEP_0179045800 /NCGR_PEP_ID=MMETSP0796-20121207/18362_1 /TAXON_ID=73915 /ORGANISM="Pyrodinium bahamense, Strain pbaha01" /LENGTH=376 /DNA_ID=CAMNT_0020742213 /DNA_START=74 /DNA_END=1204 /DNA_ORIENTATION=+
MGAQESRLLRSKSLEFCEHSYDDEQYDAAYTWVKSRPNVALVHFFSQADMWIVCFRGTELSGTILQDLRTVPGPNDLSGRGRTHTGFFTAYQNLRKEVMAAVNCKACSNITALGHSLGGAMATLFAVDLKQTYGEGCSVRVVTYGSPRVGDRSFVEHYRSLGLEQSTHRHVNLQDPVTTVPPEAMSYEHVCPAIERDAAGAQESDAPTRESSSSSGFGGKVGMATLLGAFAGAALGALAADRSDSAKAQVFNETERDIQVRIETKCAGQWPESGPLLVILPGKSSTKANQDQRFIIEAGGQRFVHEVANGGEKQVKVKQITRETVYLIKDDWPSVVQLAAGSVLKGAGAGALAGAGAYTAYSLQYHKLTSYRALHL